MVVLSDSGVGTYAPKSEQIIGTRPAAQGRVGSTGKKAENRTLYKNGRTDLLLKIDENCTKTGGGNRFEGNYSFAKAQTVLALCYPSTMYNNAD